MKHGLKLVDIAVPEAWVDYNGHMNDATYSIPFSLAVNALIERLGMDAHFRERERCTMYTLESHTRFLREAFQGEHLRVVLQMLDSDNKRLHIFMRLLDNVGVVRATSEQMLMLVDTAAGRPTIFRGELADRIETLVTEHGHLPQPQDMGRSVRIRRV
jgi:acyl-CoA thioester hydrolase